MKRIELEIIHSHNNQFLGRRQLKDSSCVFSIGSSKHASMQLIGEGISGLHAIIEICEDGNWRISDLGSESGTWVKKKPIFSHELKSPTTIHIGKHLLKIIPRNIESQLFINNSAVTSGGKAFHQIVVKKHGCTVDTQLINPQEAFNLKLGNDIKYIPAPQSTEWCTYEYKDVTVLSRKVFSQALEENFKDKVSTVWDPQLKKPLAAALALSIILALMIMLSPERPAEEEIAKLDKKKVLNKYTRIIYDKKYIKKRKKIARKNNRKLVSRKKVPKKTRRGGGSLSKKMAAKSKKSQSTPRVVSAIRSAKLSQLLGKISKRAAKTAKFIQADGIVADSKRSSGTGLAQGGLKARGLNTKGSSFGKSQKISGVSTKGKAGGSSSYRGISGLSTGSVGAANVGIIEEETIIQGGLDKGVIARIIKSHLGQIRYCYERQLSSNPDLYGKVLVQFAIGAAGTTGQQKVKNSSLSNALIEGCMLRKIAHWKFPKPSGGTTVNVTYPFLFKNTN